jgi:hypothetical protein
MFRPHLELYRLAEAEDSKCFVLAEWSSKTKQKKKKKAVAKRESYSVSIQVVGKISRLSLKASDLQIEQPPYPFPHRHHLSSLDQQHAQLASAITYAVRPSSPV